MHAKHLYEVMVEGVQESIYKGDNETHAFALYEMYCDATLVPSSRAFACRVSLYRQWQAHSGTAFSPSSG